MCIYIYIYIHTYIHTCIHTYIHTYIIITIHKNIILIDINSKRNSNDETHDRGGAAQEYILYYTILCYIYIYIYRHAYIYIYIERERDI